ncbi:hypothetical protein [Solilutibacter silvestris]|uniref:hypothetical protein n=1 Tax=Solilutibacter silvestris TaxID=1645665 RepID=UPI000CA00F40|nr:hypothetical protein [Lysobacter silvestris]
MAKDFDPSHRIPPLKWSLAQIREATGESMQVIFDAIRLGHLDTFLCGRRRFARPEAVARWIDFLEARSKAGHPVVYRARQYDHERG